MKIANFLFFILFAFLSSSFIKKSEPIYSCNPEIDLWVKKNKKNFTKMTRGQLIAFSNPEYQYAIYRSLSPELKSAIWREKLLLEINRANVTEADKNHINLLIKFLTPELYRNLKTNKPVHPFLNEWETIALTKLNWTQEKIFSIGYSWMTSEELHQNSFISSYISLSGSCNCNSTLWCAWIGVGFCETGGCSLATGCGLGGVSSCNGVCNSPSLPQDQ